MVSRPAVGANGAAHGERRRGRTSEELLAWRNQLEHQWAEQATREVEQGHRTVAKGAVRSADAHDRVHDASRTETEPR
jgi:hypothetical protein